MKKIFTIAALAALAISGAQAADFTVTVKGAPVTNGETVEVKGTFDIEKWDEEPDNKDWWSYKLLIDPEIEVTSPAGGTYTAVVKNGGTDNLKWCGFGTDLCEMIPGGGQMSRTATLNANTPMNFAMEYEPFLSAEPAEGFTLDFPVEVSVTNASNPADYIEFTCRMTYIHGGTGINGVENEVTFGIENGTVVAGGAPVEVYSIQGQRVNNSNLHGLYVVKAGNKVAKVIVK